MHEAVWDELRQVQDTLAAALAELAELRRKVATLEEQMGQPQASVEAIEQVVYRLEGK